MHRKIVSCPARSLREPATRLIARGRKAGGRVGRLLVGRLSYGRTRGDRGMSTAEYAVGTIAACGFAALLFKIVTSDDVRELLVGLINRALNIAG